MRSTRWLALTWAGRALGCLPLLVLAQETPHSAHYRLLGSVFASGGSAATQEGDIVLTASAVEATGGPVMSADGWYLTPGYVQPPAWPLAPPQGLSLLVGQETLSLCWRPVTHAARYQVWWSSDPWSGFAPHPGGSLQDTCWTAPAPAPQGFYRVQARR